MAYYRKRRQENDLFSSLIKLFQWSFYQGGLKLCFISIGTILLAFFGVLMALGMKMGYIPFSIAGGFILMSFICWLFEVKR